ncbi:MAG TPA: isochorismatase family protein [Thermodesulfobacteriota bacterium]|nr:isochorismatase family protein [Deltaproteobacteria bacterium]HNR14077.1 isochorismatase family protein [Thermodesulfobacteriota bacterium]HNU73000.1 isochorismatase family protein [Thermodesulfobacteriota bacterium]HOC39469.1 isochorismatase family protein [Thermodesulfobacteriota bacterium]
MVNKSSDIAKWNSHHWIPRKDVAALLVIDMQMFFASLAREILKPLRHLIQTCRIQDVPVIYTAHGHRDPHKDAGMLGIWWHDLIIEGTGDHRIIKEIAPEPGEKVLPKRRYSAFFGTDLDQYLRGKGIEDLIISGVMTNLCCETTARDAFIRDYRVFFLADGTATIDPELHTATLKNLAFGFATVLTIADVESGWESVVTV